MTRILVVNPNTTQAMTDEIAAAARAVARPDTEITCVSPEAGPRSIEGFADEAIAAYHVLELVTRTRGEYDGYVIACFGDPGLHACREVADVPVVGIAEAAMHMASLVAHRWSIVTVIPRVEPFLAEAVQRALHEAGRRLVDVNEGHLALLPRKSRDDRSADAAAAAGHEHGTVGE